MGKEVDWRQAKFHLICTSCDVTKILLPSYKTVSIYPATENMSSCLVRGAFDFLIEQNSKQVNDSPCLVSARFCHNKGLCGRSRVD